MTPWRRARWSCCALSVLLMLGVGCRTRARAPRPGPAAQRPVVATSDGVQFEDVAEQVGLNFRWRPQPRPLRSLEAFGCGCAFLDYDNDGWQDVLLIAKPRVALFRNERGRFANVTARTGLDRPQGDWKGCAIGDYDGDGWLDILLTGYRRLALLKNQQGTTFTDTTFAAGLSPTNRNHWASSAGFMDLDANGTLDLVVLNYVVFNETVKQYCELRPGLKSG